MLGLNHENNIREKLLWSRTGATSVIHINKRYYHPEDVYPLDNNVFTTIGTFCHLPFPVKFSRVPMIDSSSHFEVASEFYGSIRIFSK